MLRTNFGETRPVFVKIWYSAKYCKKMEWNQYFRITNEILRIGVLYYILINLHIQGKINHNLGPEF